MRSARGSLGSNVCGGRPQSGPHPTGAAEVRLPAADIGAKADARRLAVRLSPRRAYSRRVIILPVSEDRNESGRLDGPYELRPIGWVESPLTDRTAAPKQGDEGSPEAWLVFEEAVGDALADLRIESEVLVLTWLDRAHRDVLRVHPRGDPVRAEEGVFTTRSPDRPNPIGLHRVRILSIEGTRLRVGDLEALDGTPVLDVKPVLDPDLDR
jgi:tRNA-Thr(GGU) m(6)t(6)A37 methyltransferase TsaA